MYPFEIETGATDAEKYRLGLIGPNASDGLKETHEATGLPALLIALQEAVGVHTVESSGPAEWENVTAIGMTPPSSITGSWLAVGKIGFVTMRVNWQSGFTSGAESALDDLPWPAASGQLVGDFFKGGSDYYQLVALVDGQSLTLREYDSAGKRSTPRDAPGNGNRFCTLAGSFLLR